MNGTGLKALTIQKQIPTKMIMKILNQVTIAEIVLAPYQKVASR